MRRLSLLWLLSLAPLLAAAEPVTRTVDLRNRPADEVAAELKPHLPPGTLLIPAGQRLVLRGEAAAVSGMAGLAEALDVAQRRLRITVRPADGHEADAAGSSVRHYGTGRSEPHDRPQTVTATEGRWARIDFDQSVPQVTQSIAADGSSRQAIEYKEINNGFEVLPRLRGEIVSLEVRARRGAPALSGGGVIEQQRIETIISGPVGQWLDLGGGAETSPPLGKVYSTRQREVGRQPLQIKVEILP